MNRKLGYSVLLLVLCCTVWIASCAPAHHYAYQIPEQTGDGWATASLDDVGIDKELLGQLIERIDRHEYRNVHGIVIVKIWDRYAPQPGVGHEKLYVCAGGHCHRSRLHPKC